MTPGRLTSMSFQMSAVTGILRVAGRVLALRGEQPIKPAKPAVPNKRVAAKHDVQQVTIAGTRCFWIDEAKRSNGVFVYLHGGSYTFQAVGMHWDLIAAIADDLGMAALFVDYTLAPAASFPVARNEAIAVLESLAGETIVLGGDSAGGGLAVSTCIALRDSGKPLPKVMALTAPWLDISMTNPDAVAFEKKDPMLTAKGLLQSSVLYAGSTDLKDPGVSPVYDDGHGMPPTIMTTGTADMLIFDDRLWAAKSGATLVETPGGIHAFPVLVRLLPEGRKAVADQVAFVKQHLAVA